MRTFAVVLALVFRTPSFGCSCMEVPVCYTVERAPVIFIGEVVDGGITSLADDPWFSDVRYARFKVIEAFRGLPRGTATVDVELHLWRGMCAPVPYYRGKRYLVTPAQRDGIYFDGACFSGQDVDKATDRVQYIRDYFSGKMPANIHGRIATGSDVWLLDYLVSIGQAKLLHGARVTATKGGAEYSTASDTMGKYFLPLPGSGSYIVRTELPPYKIQPAKVISVNANGCVIQDFALQVENSISGQVFNEKGEYVEHVKVSLVDAESQAGPPAAEEWVAGEGHYRFGHVPPARYILAINPDGPVPDFPFGTTYYPHTSERRSAKVIEIKGYQSDLAGMNLVTGNGVKFRQVTVNVTFTDGTPMRTVVIRSTLLNGANLSSGPQRHVGAGFGTGAGIGVVKFDAPANLPFRMEVEDWYGRDLGGTYAADFDAGTTPISHEFKIKR
jgi:hypothetical protein